MFLFVWLWKPPVTRNKGIGQDGNQSFPGRIDDPAADDAGGIAAKAHGGSQTLFAAGAAFLKSPVHVKGNPGQIAQVFQQGEQWEEDGHRRQHYRNHLGQNPVNAVNQYVDQLDRGIKQQ